MTEPGARAFAFPKIRSRQIIASASASIDGMPARACSIDRRQSDAFVAAQKNVLRCKNYFTLQKLIYL
jgi:hypothetical protein